MNEREYLLSLFEKKEHDPDAVTAEELATELGITTSQMRKRLDEKVKTGEAVHAWIYRNTRWMRGYKFNHNFNKQPS